MGHTTVFGHSRAGRPLIAWSIGPTEASRRILVVGIIHGNERAGYPVALALMGTVPAPNTEVIVVADLNPDGVVADTRQNADGVDLNRNFPYHWAPLGRRGDQQYSGTAALSEPESRAMTALIERLRPTVSVWFHQPVGVVDESGGTLAVEARFSALAGLPLRKLVRYHGSAVSWENAAFPGTTAFVVELPKHVGSQLRRRLLTSLRDLEH